MLVLYQFQEMETMTFRFARAIALALALTAPVVGQAQVVTPANQTSLGWGPASATRTPFNGGTQAITGAQPRSGNGSLQLNIPTGSSRSGYGMGFTTLADGLAADVCAASNCMTLGSLANLRVMNFDLFTPSVDGSTAVFRLYFGLTNPNAPLVQRYGSLIWTASANGGTATDTWQNFNFMTGNSALRPVSRNGANVAGQVDLGCVEANRTGNIDVVSQTLGVWLATCDGTGGTLNLANAQILGFDFGQGANGNSVGQVGYVDNVSVGWHDRRSVDTYNFEASVVPEPSTYALMAGGLIGVFGFARRRRNTASIS